MVWMWSFAPLLITYICAFNLIYLTFLFFSYQFWAVRIFSFLLGYIFIFDLLGEKILIYVQVLCELGTSCGPSDIHLCDVGLNVPVCDSSSLYCSMKNILLQQSPLTSFQPVKGVNKHNRDGMWHTLETLLHIPTLFLPTHTHKSFFSKSS